MKIHRFSWKNIENAWIFMKNLALMIFPDFPATAWKYPPGVMCEPNPYRCPCCARQAGTVASRRLLTQVDIRQERSDHNHYYTAYSKMKLLRMFLKLLYIFNSSASSSYAFSWYPSPVSSSISSCWPCHTPKSVRNTWPPCRRDPSHGHSCSLRTASSCSISSSLSSSTATPSLR